MQQLLYLIKYLKYKFTAKHKGGHGIHSPFVFDLLTDIIEPRKQYYAFSVIEKIRSELGRDRGSIIVKDFGAGSATMKHKRKIRDMERISSVKNKYGELLFRLVNRFEPKNILELGTSIGISTLYLSLANTKTKVTTIEGCEETAKVAGRVFEKANLKNIEIVVNNFDKVLPEILKNTDKLDFVFFDGNHRREPTLNYFEQCVSKAHNDTVFIFDDIHWSNDMTSAWEEICKHPKTVATIDLFFFGLVFFRQEMKKQNFVINF